MLDTPKESNILKEKNSTINKIPVSSLTKPKGKYTNKINKLYSFLLF